MPGPEVALYGFMIGLYLAPHLARRVYHGKGVTTCN